jgi:hypothetical protein
VFGLNADDLVKVIGAIGAAGAVVIGSYAKVVLARSRGARKRSFQKIRRLEDFADELAKAEPNRVYLANLAIAMKNDQREAADRRDAEDDH